jgi:ResB-like family
MSELRTSFIKFFTSLQLTVVLLALSIVLIFAATLDQVNLGIWAVQEKYFRTFFVLWNVKGFPLPVFPGGYFIGGLLLINLIASHVYRFRFSWKKSGIQLTHAGLIILLVGELLTGLMQEDYQLRLDQGQTRNYSESYLYNELAVIDATDPDWDQVVAIPEKRLRDTDPIQHERLPFRIATRAYYPNAAVQLREELGNQSAPPPATRDIGARLAIIPMAVTYKPNERNFPTAVIELIGPQNVSLGTWVVSTMMQKQPQTFDYAGRTWHLVMRFERAYKPYSLTLLKFSHDRYMGTDIPKNFASKVRLHSADGTTDREALIYMNNPLRYDGLTFYQAGFDNNDMTTILQVVRNPGWLLPYIACILMGLGLTVQFGIHLFAFVSKRRSSA